MSAPGISLNGRYRLEGRPLFDVALDLPGGQWSCLLGPSGVGKSTLLRLILGLATGGTFDGTIRASDDAPLSDRVSYMAQSDLLLPWLSLTENVVLGARLRGESPDMARAERLIERVGLGAHRDKTPGALSGGMRQRAALARTLMEDRPVVLLDEPFSALDAGTRADMQELSAELLAGRTVLLVTHDPAEASRLGALILVMSRAGTQVWPGPPAAPIRAVHDPATLACQAALLDHLRKAAA
ncbi:ABC transporter ATP-binding protein [Sulfitobacter aestuarii]|uniref:ABC transporter ATP-binding protein n=1 Tax=Sulfitobacter aestuarii TaxID=2161676 RepID=A0ABW5U146_9RHOB